MKYIYLLKGTKDFYKIGITQNISTRLHNINTSNHDDIFVVTSRLVENAPILETELHAKYSHRRTKSEWFHFTPEEALEVCIEIHRAPGFIEKPVDKQVKESMLLLTKNQLEIRNDITEIKKELHRVSPPKPKPAPSLPQVKLKDTQKEKHADDGYILEEAKSLIYNADYVSASFLQRKLRIGYSRAARIIDILEEQGFVSSGYPRKVIKMVWEKQLNGQTKPTQ